MIEPSPVYLKKSLNCETSSNFNRCSFSCADTDCIPDNRKNMNEATSPLCKIIQLFISIYLQTTLKYFFLLVQDISSCQPVKIGYLLLFPSFVFSQFRSQYGCYFRSYLQSSTSIQKKHSHTAGQHVFYILRKLLANCPYHMSRCKSITFIQLFSKRRLFFYHLLYFIRITAIHIIPIILIKCLFSISMNSQILRHTFRRRQSAYCNSLINDIFSHCTISSPLSSGNCQKSRFRTINFMIPRDLFRFLRISMCWRRQWTQTGKNRKYIGTGWLSV